MGKFNRGGGGSFGGGHGGHGGGYAARGAGGFGGGRKPWDKGGDRGPVTLHDVTCSDCGKSCKVPFRPSGDKPVYCNACFANHGGPDRANSGPMPRRDARPGFNDKTDYRTPARVASPDDFSSNDIKTQLAMINIKLDKILKAKGEDPTPKKPVVALESSDEAKEVPVIKSKKVVKSIKSKKVSKK